MKVIEQEHKESPAPFWSLLKEKNSSMPAARTAMLWKLYYIMSVEISYFLDAFDYWYM